jgi:hypothetical protein
VEDKTDSFLLCWTRGTYEGFGRGELGDRVDALYAMLDRRYR